MDRITRKTLKDDRFAAEVTHSVSYLTEHRQQALLYGGIAVAVLVIALGIFFYRQQRRTSAHRALYKALETYHALVTEEERPGRVTFKTEAEKHAKAQKEFETLSREFSGTVEGKIGGYYVGLVYRDLGKPAEAQKHLEQAVRDGQENVVALARLALARPGRVRGILECGAAFAVVFIPYLGLNYALSGSLWPNTFYAKQAEYAILRAAPLLERAARVGLLPFVGAPALLAPGLAGAAIRWGREQRWGALLPLGWALTFLAAYIVRLPVTYQHGRYLIPVIPVLAAVGVGGLADLLRLRAPTLLPRVVSRVWTLAAALLLAVFLGVGAQAYARDVQIIESEMVAAALWVNAHTPPGALIAAHDIGALGYFGGRPILDLAGLASPEVIPFIRDEARLGEWLRASGAQYLVTFPGWYPGLTGALAADRVFTTGAPFSPAAGGENMAVYALPGR